MRLWCRARARSAARLGERLEHLEVALEVRGHLGLVALELHGHAHARAVVGERQRPGVVAASSPPSTRRRVRPASVHSGRRPWPRSGVAVRPPAVADRVAAMIAESPTPHLPRGAGGPLRRAAGRVVPSRAAALVLEPDPLARLLGRAGRRRRSGFRVAEARAPAARASRPSAVFVPLARRGRLPPRLRGARDGAAPRRCGGRAGGPAAAAPLVVGYGAGPPALLAAHRAHRCADLVLRLTAAAGRRALRAPAGGGRRSPPPASPSARPTCSCCCSRGLTTAGRRARGSASRRAPRARTAARCCASWAPATGGRCAPGSSPAPALAGLRRAAPPCPEVCLGGRANFAEESAVAAPRRARPYLRAGRGPRRSADGPRPFASTGSAGGAHEQRSRPRARPSAVSSGRRSASSPSSS